MILGWPVPLTFATVILAWGWFFFWFSRWESHYKAREAAQESIEVARRIEVVDAYWAMRVMEAKHPEGTNFALAYQYRWLSPEDMAVQDRFERAIAHIPEGLFCPPTAQETREAIQRARQRAEQARQRAEQAA